MAWDGVERRSAPPATRRFVVIVAVLLTLYMSFIFWRLQVNGANDRERQSQGRVTQYKNDLASCDRGDDIRDALNRMGAQLSTGTCRSKVKKP